MNNLQKYHNWLKKYNVANPISMRPEAPNEFNFKTLWIPQWSDNRTATFDLNHQIEPEFSQPLYGFNGNCDTPYQIIEVPKWLTNEHLGELCRRVALKLNKPKEYPIDRVLKADSRMNTIKEELHEFIAELSLLMF